MAPDVRFHDIRKLLEDHGWQLARISGSHHVFTKAGRSPISIPVHRNRVKAVYARAINKIIEQERREEREGRD